MRPILRFKQTHVAHHGDANLTDPYDPECNYLDPAVWNGLAPRMRSLLRVNNTLTWRLIGMVACVRRDIAAAVAGARVTMRDRLAHPSGVVLTK